eukprot:gene5745-7934_t
MADWFSSIASQAIQFADSLAESIVSQANEAQEILDAEQRKIHAESLALSSTTTQSTRMPWESEDESLAILSQELMEKIFTLPLSDDNFTITSPNSNEVKFIFNDFIPIAMKLLQLDTNLANVHARVSPRMDEQIFWFNYYSRISFLRASSGIDGPLAKQQSLKYREVDIIHSAASITKNKGMERSNNNIITNPNNFISNNTKINIEKQSSINSKSSSSSSSSNNNNNKNNSKKNSSGYVDGNTGDTMDELTDNTNNDSNDNKDVIFDYSEEDYDDISKIIPDNNNNNDNNTSFSKLENDELEAQIALELAADLDVDGDDDDNISIDINMDDDD